jgi:hypothetical protein
MNIERTYTVDYIEIETLCQTSSGCTCPDYPWRTDPQCPEHGEDCHCVLPEQHCQVCEAQVRETYPEWSFLP